MKRKCLNCYYYNNGICDMGENGTEYDEPYCELGHKICNIGETEKDFCCYLSDKTFKNKEIKYITSQSEEANYWHVVGLEQNYIFKVFHKLKIDMQKNINNENYDTISILQFLSDNDITLTVDGTAKKNIDIQVYGEVEYEQQ